jgi:DNA-binding response OmpR family regulator
MGEVLEGSAGQVLLVGGDPDVRRTLQVYLGAHQISVQAVDRGDEALTICRQSPPDAIILNWHVADAEGPELCRQIRADGRGGEFFILALLPTSEREHKLAALEAGADDVMALPIDIEGVRLRIQEVLRR